MAGEDLLEGADSGAPGKHGHKKLGKGQKIGLVIGVVTIALIIVQIERAKSSTATGATSSSIDPQTGYPYGSTQDEAALAQLSAGADIGAGGGGGGGLSGLTSSTFDPSADATLSSLDADVAALNTNFATFFAAPAPAPVTPSAAPAPAGSSPFLPGATWASAASQAADGTAGGLFPGAVEGGFFTPAQAAAVESSVYGTTVAPVPSPGDTHAIAVSKSSLAANQKAQKAGTATKAQLAAIPVEQRRLTQLTK